MTWNPDLYNEYKEVRYKPFYDLMTLIQPRESIKGVDLGCGTGEQTAILAQKLDAASFLGIDSSPKMLEQSVAFQRDNLHFSLQPIEAVVDSNEHYDLVFSNAALQWVDNHELLFPQIIRLLTSGGQLAIQMPTQNENLLNRILMEMVEEEPYLSFLAHFRRISPVLSMDDYARILFDHEMVNINISQKVYPVIAKDTETLYRFISGTSLLPYLERLQGEHKEHFINEFKHRIAQHFKKYPAIYAFKRILIYGCKL